MAERGPAEVMRVDGAEALERCYGGPGPGVSHLHDGILGFFANGGRTAYVARVPEPGAAALIAGIDRMADADGVALLVVPDEAVWGPEVAAAMVARCERRRDRIAVLSTPRDPGPDGPPPPPDSSFAVAYHPWITITDPGRGTRAVPPAGHVAGVIARTDRERGVHAAPAGVPLRDATGLVARLSSRDTEALAARRINAIVTRGVPLVWGARTAAVDPEWKYVNVRRLFIFLEHSIDEATQWAVFEPNDEPLWARRARRTIEDFLFSAVARRRPARHEAGRGVLRALRPHDDDPERPRQRPARLPHRRRRRQARRVRDLPRSASGPPRRRSRPSRSWWRSTTSPPPGSPR